MSKISDRLVVAGVSLSLLSIPAAVLLPNDYRYCAVLMSLAGFFTWLAGTLLGRKVMERLPVRLELHDFIDQSSDELASDVLGVIASAVNNGRPAAAVAQLPDSLVVAPDPAASMRFFEDVVTTTADKSAAELRAMVIAAADVAAQALFVVNAFDTAATAECIRGMALAHKVMGPGFDIGDDES